MSIEGELLALRQRGKGRPAVGDENAARAIAFARRQRPPMTRFAYELRICLGWASLSRQMVYKWEMGQSRVPASVLFAAAEVCSISVDRLLADSRRP
jgi:transcriptional regulator with XRE-family HTH domain